MTVGIALTAACAFAGTKNANGVYVLDDNEVLHLTDATVGDYAGGIQFKGKGSVVEFDTTAAPSMTLTSPNQNRNCTVRKVNDAPWTITKGQSDFWGTYEIDGGIVTVGAESAFGYIWSILPVVVKSGAMITMSTAYNQRSRVFHISGTGVDNRGVIELKNHMGATCIDRVVLDDDALVKVSGSYYWFLNDLDPNGHVLTVDCKDVYNYGPLGTGELRLVRDAGSTYYHRAGAASVAADPEGKIVLASPSGVAAYCFAGPVTNTTVARPFELQGTAKIYAALDNNSVIGLDTNHYCFTEGLAFAEGTSPSRLILTTGYADGQTAARGYKTQLSFLGPITGDGTSYSHVSVQTKTATGGLLCEVSGDEEKWDFEHFCKLAAEATWTDSAFPLLHPTGETLPELNVAGGVPARKWGATGEVAFNFATPADTENFQWWCGVAHLRCLKPLTLRGLTLNAGTHYRDGDVPIRTAVVLSGGTTVEVGKTQLPLTVAGTPASYAAIPHFVVTNASIVQTEPIPDAYEKSYDYMLGIGADKNNNLYRRCVLDVCADAVVSNKLVVGGTGLNTDGVETGYGAVHQFGGKVYSLGNKGAVYLDSGVGIGGRGTGSYDLWGGEFHAVGNFLIGGYSQGAWTQYGGTSVFDKYQNGGSFGVGAANNGKGNLTVFGGEMTVNLNANAQGCYQSNGAAALAVVGPTAKLTINGTVNFNKATGNLHYPCTVAVAGGTLRCGCEEAIPADRDLTLAGGGVLDLNGKAVTIRSVTMGAGGGSIANAENATLPGEVTATIDIDDLLVGKSLELQGDVNLSGWTITVTGDLSKVREEDCKYAIVKTSGGALSGTPTINIGEIPKGWSLHRNANRISLSVDRGILLIVR